MPGTTKFSHDFTIAAQSVRGGPSLGEVVTVFLHHITSVEDPNDGTLVLVFRDSTERVIKGDLSKDQVQGWAESARSAPLEALNDSIAATMAEKTGLKVDRERMTLEARVRQNDPEDPS